MRRTLTISLLLKAVTGLMALGLVAVFAASAQDAFMQRSAAEQTRAAVEVSRDLFAAMQAVRVERGTVDTALETATPADRDTQRAILVLRHRSKAALEAALAELGGIGIKPGNAALASVVSSRARFERMRAAADAALRQPKSRRPPGLGPRWNAAGSHFADTIDALSERLSVAIDRSDPAIAELMKIKQLAWAVRSAAGLARLQIGTVIARGKPMSADERRRLAYLAGRIDAAWRLIEQDARWRTLPTPLEASINRAERLYFDELRAKRNALLGEIEAGRPAPLTGMQWVNASNPGLAALMKVADTALVQCGHRAAAEVAVADRSLAGAVALILFFLGFGLLALLFVARRVARPMATIIAAMDGVAEGDLDTELPYTRRNDEIGALARALAVFRDKGRENRRLAAELLQQERLSTLGQLTAAVAHELRNPLSAIRNSLYAVGEMAAAEGLEIGRPMRRAERSIARCDRIIGELLDYTSVRDLRASPALFDNWLDELLDAQGLPQGISLVRNLSAPGLAISFDPERMRDVVLHLIENAIQALTASDAGQRRIVVTTAARLDAFELVVADNGPGIPAEAMPKVFEPLFSTKSFGTGLGLPMVKQVVERHGGTIALASTPGKGTKVTLRLPRPAQAEIAA